MKGGERHRAVTLPDLQQKLPIFFEKKYRVDKDGRYLAVWRNYSLIDVVQPRMLPCRESLLCLTAP